MREVQVLHDGRQVAPQVTVFVDVADDLLPEQVVFFVEVQEGELFQQAVVERDGIGQGEFFPLFIIERLLGLEARRIVVHIVVDGVLVLLRLLGLLGLGLNRFIGGASSFPASSWTSSCSSSNPSSRSGFISSSALIFCSRASVGSCSIFRYCTC